MSADADRLYDLLAQDELQPGVAQGQVQAFSTAAKDEVCKRVAGESPANPLVLARLNLIRTPSNRAQQEAAYLANLHAPSATARRAALVELEELGHPQARAAAMEAAMDAEERVASLATSLLVQHASEPEVRRRLEEVLVARKSEERYHQLVGLLAAHGIEAPAAVVASADGGSRDGGSDGGAGG